jgi:hypothetical protein
MGLVSAAAGKYLNWLTGLTFLIGTRVSAQDTTIRAEDSIQMAPYRSGTGGIEAAHGWRNDGFKGFFFRVFYEAEIGRTFLNAGAFSYNKINDGFGFDFRLRMPWIFYPGGSHTNFSPLAGFSFTIWPTDKSTVSVGIPIGIGYEYLIENFPNISASVNVSPQFNLSKEPNTLIYDLRIGIRFD